MMWACAAASGASRSARRRRERALADAETRHGRASWQLHTLYLTAVSRSRDRVNGESRLRAECGGGAEGRSCDKLKHFQSRRHTDKTTHKSNLHTVCVETRSTAPSHMSSSRHRHSTRLVHRASPTRVHPHPTGTPVRCSPWQASPLRAMVAPPRTHTAAMPRCCEQAPTVNAPSLSPPRARPSR